MFDPSDIKEFFPAEKAFDKWLSLQDVGGEESFERSDKSFTDCWWRRGRKRDSLGLFRAHRRYQGEYSRVDIGVLNGRLPRSDGPGRVSGPGASFLDGIDLRIEGHPVDPDSEPG